jgi:hypothetical protein
VSDEDLSEVSRRTGTPAGHANGRQPRLSDPPPGTGAAGRPSPDDRPFTDDDEVVWKRHRPPVFLRPKVLLLALAVLVTAGALIFGKHRASWPPPADCDRTAIKGGVGHLRAGYPLYWAATGPNHRYAVTVGASGVAVQPDGTLRVTGGESQAGAKAAVVQQPTTMTGCRLAGHFTMPLPLGEYSLRLWRLDGGTATQVARARVDSDG